ncbi:MAG: M20/M25/M40 family metallo-hydrolase, partial [Planctomycetota bacterium]
LPSEARAKFSMRLVPDQDPEEIRELTETYLRDIAPSTVTIDVLYHHGARPVIVERHGAAVQAVQTAIEKAFGREAVFIREGGSIPVCNTFQAELGVESLLVGLGLPDDNPHSPNERFRLKDYYRGMVLMAEFLTALRSS